MPCRNPCRLYIHLAFTTLEGPTEYVNARWLQSLRTWNPTWHQIDLIRGHSDYLQKPPLGGRPNTTSRDHGIRTLLIVDLFYFYHEWGPTWTNYHWNNNIWLSTWSHTTSHYTQRSVTILHDLEVYRDNLWIFSFGLSQSSDHFYHFDSLGLCVKWPNLQW